MEVPFALWSLWVRPCRFPHTHSLVKLCLHRHLAWYIILFLGNICFFVPSSLGRLLSEPLGQFTCDQGSFHACLPSTHRNVRGLHCVVAGSSYCAAVQYTLLQQLLPRVHILLRAVRVFVISGPRAPFSTRWSATPARMEHMLSERSRASSACLHP